MRLLSFAVLVFAISLVPARAQNYDPRYPVCMKIYEGSFGSGNWTNCSFTSLAQCQASASGRSAMCEMNPYYPHAQIGGQGDYRRPPRPY